MSDADEDEPVTVFPTRHVHLRGVRAGDPRAAQFWALTAELDRARTPLPQYRRALARIATTLRLPAPRVTETPPPEILVRTQLPIADLTPEAALLHPGWAIKRVRATANAIKAGTPFPWMETSTTTGERRIVFAPIPLPPARPRAARARTTPTGGRPPHPFTSEILEDIRRHPGIAPLARSKELTKRYTQSAASRGATAPKAVSESLVRKLALQERDSQR